MLTQRSDIKLKDQAAFEDTLARHADHHRIGPLRFEVGVERAIDRVDHYQRITHVREARHAACQGSACGRVADRSASAGARQTHRVGTPRVSTDVLGEGLGAQREIEHGVPAPEARDRHCRPLRDLVGARLLVPLVLIDADQQS